MIEWIKSLITPKQTESDSGLRKTVSENPQDFSNFGTDRNDRLLVVEDTFFITGRGTVVTGKVSKGSFQKGDSITIKSKDGTSEIFSKILGVEKFRETTDIAKEGENVGFVLENVPKTDVRGGDTIY